MWKKKIISSSNKFITVRSIYFERTRTNLMSLSHSHLL